MWTHCYTFKNTEKYKEKNKLPIIPLKPTLSS